MKSFRLSQECLKIIACVTMLIDHFAVVLLWKLFPNANFTVELYHICRIIGRLAFPIYCFLLAEGAFYTRNRKEYGLRLLVGLVLSEIPFDVLFYGTVTFAHQSVMVTLLLGYLYAIAMNYIDSLGYRIFLMLPFAMTAELLHADYGGWGVAMIGLFVITREVPNCIWIQTLGLCAIAWMMGGAAVTVGALVLPIQVFSAAAMIPIAMYDGRKRTNNIWVRRVFYLFYPAHLMALYLMTRL